MSSSDASQSSPQPPNKRKRSVGAIHDAHVPVAKRYRSEAAISDAAVSTPCSSVSYPSLPLDASRKEIRLLTLQPGRFGQPICCALTTVSLAEHPKYEALSYTWGASLLGRTVTVNFVQLPVTDNLWSALQRLRHVFDSRILWVDALCINQADLVERGHSVSLMGSIYGSTSRVLVWLGESKASEVEPFTLAQDKPWSPGISRVSDALSIRDRERLPDREKAWRYNDLRHQSFVAAVKSTTPEWWRRAWTVQEVVLAPSEPLVCFGAFTLPWSGMSRLLESSGDPPFVSLRDHMKNVETLRNIVSVGPSSLSHIYNLTGSTEATDPRDKVYSVLGLINDIEVARIRADYNVPLLDLHCRATCAVIESSGSLDILARSPCFSATTAGSHIPQYMHDWRPSQLSVSSWIVDWTEEFDNSSFSDSDNTMSLGFVQSLLTSSQVWRLEDPIAELYAVQPRRLPVKGCLIDYIAVTCIQQDNFDLHLDEVSKAQRNLMMYRMASILRLVLLEDTYTVSDRDERSSPEPILQSRDAGSGDAAKPTEGANPTVYAINEVRLPSSASSMPRDRTQQDVAKMLHKRATHTQCSKILHLLQRLVKTGKLDLALVAEHQSLRQTAPDDSTWYGDILYGEQGWQSDEWFAMHDDRAVQYLLSGESDKAAHADRILDLNPYRRYRAVSDLDSEHDLLQWKTYTKSKYRNSSLFCTSSGLMGLGLDYVQKGDALVVIPEAQQSQVLILRPEPDGEFLFLGFGIIMKSELDAYTQSAGIQRFREATFVIK